AQAISAFGFPQFQTRLTVQACGCLTPCGRDTANCCCAKSRPALEPVAEVKPRCAKCKKSSPEECAAPTPKVKWVSGVKARQCRGDGPMGASTEAPAVSPRIESQPIIAAPTIDAIRFDNSSIPSRIDLPDEPPPRIA